MERIGHVLVPVDGSASALAAAAMAGLLARNCNSRVTIIVAHSEAAVALPGLAEAVLPGSMPFHSFPKKEARKHFEAATDEHVIPPVEAALGTVPGGVSAIQVWGHAGEEICRYAAANAVDLIVMGKRGRGKFKRLQLGGVSAHVLAHAPCAVTVAA